MVPSFHFRSAGVLLRTMVLLFSIQSTCFQATFVRCNYSTGCPSGLFCDYYKDVSVQEFYNPCNSSSDCQSDSGECVFLSTIGDLSKCSSSPSRPSYKNCFCAPHQYGCDINTFPLAISDEDIEYCIPCSFLRPLNASLEKTKCPKYYTFEDPPEGEQGSYFHSCHSDNSCDVDLYCSTFTNEGHSGSCSNHENVSVTENCHCAPYDFIACSFFLPCTSGYSCVRSTINQKPSCVPYNSRSRIDPPIQNVRTIPQWSLVTVASTEIMFVCFKSVAIMRTEKKWLRFALVSFIIETVIGLGLTALQSSIIIIIYIERFDNVNHVLVVLGSLLFVFTETCVIISESFTMRRKMRKEDVEYERNQRRFRVSLVRRVVMKWICIGTMIASLLIHQFYLNAGMILVLVLLITFICVSSFKLHYRDRVILSVIHLILSLTATAVLVIIKHYGARYGGGCTRLNFDHVSILLFIFGFNILMTAISSFRLHGYRETKRITAEQVEFLETAVFGVSVPAIQIAEVLCA